MAAVVAACALLEVFARLGNPIRRTATRDSRGRQFPVNVWRLIRAGLGGPTPSYGQQYRPSVWRFETENTGGVLAGFLAEEDEFDRRALWRLGSWGVATVARWCWRCSPTSRRSDAARPGRGRRPGTPGAADSVGRQDSHSEAKRLHRGRNAERRSRPAVFRVTVLEQG